MNTSFPEQLWTTASEIVFNVNVLKYSKTVPGGVLSDDDVR